MPEKPYLDPPSLDEESKDVWFPYPSQSDGVPAHLVHLLNALADLNKVTYDLCVTVFSTQTRMKGLSYYEMSKVAQDLYARMQEWDKGLVGYLRPKSSDNAHILALHMYYCAIVVVMFGFVEEKANEKGLPFKNYEEARNLCLSSARRIAQLDEISQSFWGIDRVSASNTQWITLAQLALIEHLGDIANRNAFVSLSVAAKVFSRRWILGRGLLRSIQVTARQLKVTLSPPRPTHSSQSLIQPGRRKIQSFSSLHPNFTMLLKSDSEDEIQLDRFFKKWDVLQLAENHD